ncbi:unnamed protein product [Mytilus edulis]|uniref:Fido domain-containing protein n=1 Tax=Mytilus edulis TaxID=6550 RepID=A0A8S3R8K6_MYTED|nr:unnamed protein product [Mytilus edulis]
MMLEFLFRLQQDENIGLDNKDTFQHVANDVLKSFEKLDKNENARSLKSIHHKIKTVMSHLVKKPKSDQDSLPNTADIKDNCFEFPTDKDKKNNKMTETRNLLRGYRHLKHEFNHLSKKDQSNYVGEIDIEKCIQECHEVLMLDLSNETKTQPGKFSVLPRSANFEGKDYPYPWYATEEIAYQAVDTIVLEYNKMVTEISEIEDKHEKLERTLKCATVLLFGFLTLHPFSDGNGRLARLLCSHCLKVLCPFPTSIYNVFSVSNRDEYVRALVDARRDLKLSPDQIEYAEDAKKVAITILEQTPNDLCSLVIESNWFTWRQFLRRIGEDIDLF